MVSLQYELGVYVDAEEPQTPNTGGGCFSIYTNNSRFRLMEEVRTPKVLKVIVRYCTRTNFKTL